MPPTISIAMATYNGARFIAEQLESLAAQSHRPHELVVCDDGSTDATLDIVEAFGKTAPFPVRLFRNPENLGYADNFLKAAGLCEGDWVAFCDQDDVWLPEKLAVVSEAIRRHPQVMLVTHPACLVDEQLRMTGEIAWPSPERLYRRGSMSPWRSGMGCGQVFRASLVKEIPYGQRFLTGSSPGAVSPHDDWIVKLAQCLGEAYYLSRPLVLRRRHDRSVTAARRPPTKRPRSQALRTGVAEQLLLYAELARDRGQVLAACSRSSGPAYASLLAASAGRFARAAEILDRRAAWRSDRGVPRIARAAALMSLPAYWRMGAGIAGWRGAARDLIDSVRAGS